MPQLLGTLQVKTHKPVDGMSMSHRIVVPQGTRCWDMVSRVMCWGMSRKDDDAVCVKLMRVQYEQMKFSLNQNGCS